MKKLIYILLVGTIASCTVLDNGGVVITPPSVPTVNICGKIASETDVANMKISIDGMAFKDERLVRAKQVTDNHCFISIQVKSIMESMLFPDAKLEMAKKLYHQCTDKENFHIVVDSLAHKGDRDKLNAYIAQN